MEWGEGGMEQREGQTHTRPQQWTVGPVRLMYGITSVITECVCVCVCVGGYGRVRERVC